MECNWKSTLPNSSLHIVSYTVISFSEKKLSESTQNFSSYFAKSQTDKQKNKHQLSHNLPRTLYDLTHQINSTIVRYQKRTETYLHNYLNLKNVKVKKK